MSIEFFISLATIAAGLLANWWINKNKIKELTLAQIDLEQKLILNREAAEQEKKKSDADLSDRFLGIAERSGKQVESRDVTISELQSAIAVLRETIDKKEIVNREIQSAVAILQDQVGALMVDKRKLEDESIRKDGRISALEKENNELRNRIKILEDTIHNSDAQMPGTGGL